MGFCEEQKKVWNQIKIWTLTSLSKAHLLHLYASDIKFYNKGQRQTSQLT